MTDNMMTCASVDELLLDLLEGDVSAETSTAVDAHVSKCARCTALLRDIGGIRESAAALPDLAPSSDLWKGIAARIETPVVALGEKKRNRFASPVWMAAAASLLIAGSAGITYVATSRSINPPVASTVAALPAVVEKVAAPDAIAPASDVVPEPRVIEQPVASEVGNDSQGSPGRSATLVSSNAPRSVFAPDTVFSSEIRRLQRVLAERRNHLDPQTVGIVEVNLKLIDAAIQSSRAALARDPASGFLNQQLTRALDKKVELLRTVALMPSST